MNIEEIKHLFVPVSESKERELYDLGITINGTFCIPDGYLYCDEGKYYDSNGCEFTHVLDLSLLTTKSKAIELAESVFFEVSDYDKRKAIDKGVKLL